jgi:hypothetical protein
MPSSRTFVGLVSLGFALTVGTGCIGPGTSVKGRSDLLPKPGARVELRDVVTSPQPGLDIDAAALLRQATDTALKSEQLHWSGEDSRDHFVLNLEITEYRPGNAFKRWLLPGYGSTVLAIQGTLVEASTGAVAATIHHRRSIHFGGAYTIGAWQTIFQTIADDLARDLKIRIDKGGEFLVSLTPRSEQDPAPPPPEHALKIKVSRVADQRPEKSRIGEREAAFGVSMGDVYLSGRAAELLREALIDDLQVAGYRVIDSGDDVAIDTRLSRFWVHTATTPLYWDIIADIEVELTIEASRSRQPLQKNASCHQVERTYVWPSASLIGKTLDACMADLMRDVRATIKSGVSSF